MKAALVLEKNGAACRETARLLSGLGYVAAPVHTADEAINVASAIRFDVIVTCTATRGADRRSLIGELKRSAPYAAVVLLAESDEDYAHAQDARHSGVTAVIKRPASAEILRRIVEFGIDGYGLQPVAIAPAKERRRRLN
jgi:CheY-like chemotaxis protein